VRPLHLIFVLALIAVASAGTWLTIGRGSKSQPSDAASRFFDARRDYDTKSGQPMKPRWNE
jgi:Ti type entry exclusion protein TrbK